MIPQQNNYTRGKLETIPQVPGVYIFRDKEQNIVYIGKAKNLKNRVRSHFQKSDSQKANSMKNIVHTIEIVRISSDFEALIQEARLINIYKPKYNVSWKDDKHYIYILITKEEYPKVRFARRKDIRLGRFYGPYPTASTVRDLVALIRSVVPFCTQKNLGKRACFYTHIGLCSPCPSQINLSQGAQKDLQKAIYKKNILLVRLILEGKINKLENYLQKTMIKYKNKQDYENAALFRDRLLNLQKITQYSDYRFTDVSSEFAELDTFTSEQVSLNEILSPFYPALKKIIWIECYDISNIQGRHATGSQVTFQNGEPDKSRYRRFKIRLNPPAGRPDDFFMMKEMLTRRLNHKEWNLPDLLVIDGGKGQVSAAQEVLTINSIDIPVIGLAKRMEEIVIPKKVGFEVIRLKRSNPALHLVQRVRDEAHRFAHKYHELLRLKQLLQ